MNRILREIQETVAKYASIMAKISGVDVEVVDAELFRVAGTGMFASVVNMDMSAEGYAYRQVLKTGQIQTIYTPGSDLICHECPKRNKCAEKIEIAMPIRARGQIIGVIGLVGASETQRSTILQDESTYLGLIEQIGDFIAAKANECIDHKRQQTMLSALSCTINHMEQGILILSDNQTVTLSNHQARIQLNRDTLEGCRIQLNFTGDHIGGQREYQLILDKQKINILGELHIPNQADGLYSQVLVFTLSRQMQKRMYALTATVPEGVLMGSSPQTAAMCQKIDKIANSTSTVLITGESGTGKEVAATAIWRAGNRCNQQFVALNCAAIPESLLESELFGYVKGAFTGADPQGRIGKFELAHQGIIFLDEIGDMPLYLQAKLLRVLQERTIVRIGSNRQIPIDVRVIAATNKDILSMIQEGKFREDLYYRLNVIPLDILPLRQRQKDIPDLALHFAQRYSHRFGRTPCTIPPETMDALMAHPWYGNVRELENAIEFMVNMAGSDGVLSADTLPRSFLKTTATIDQPQAVHNDNLVADSSFVRRLSDIERQEIEKALAQFGDNTQGKKLAAQALGIGLATLYRKIDNFSK